jgi:carotenoid cleavage dioxygenase-like enzyme
VYRVVSFSRRYILDAQDFAGEPIATIRLPVRVPHGVHGGWAPDRITVID